MECKSKSMHLTADRYAADIKHDGRTFHIDIPRLSLYRCDNCPNSVVLTDEADEIVGVELRRVANLLQPDEIKEIRKRHGLSQKELADLFGIGEATVCRWEKGTQIQQRAFDKMLRAFEAVPALREFLSGKQVGPEARESPWLHETSSGLTG
jgi:putative zinc finger/helix-turn-helix YgiT family protein